MRTLTLPPIELNRAAGCAAAVMLAAASTATHAGLISYQSLDSTAGLSALADAAITTGGSGRFGEAATLDGTGDYFVVDAGSGISGTGARTVAAWVWADTSAGDDAAVSLGANNGSGGKFDLEVNTGTDSVEAALSGGRSETGGVGFRTQQWQFIAISIGANQTASDVLHYLNGGVPIPSLSGTRAANTANSSLRIGVRSQLNSGYWDGLVDDASVWDEQLTSDEIQGLYDVGDQLGYTADLFAVMKQVHDAGGGTVQVDGMEWSYAAGLPLSAGLNGTTDTLVLDASAGTGLTAGEVLTWTGNGDGTSLFQEANWLDSLGNVPAADTLNPDTPVSAVTGGRIEIADGTGAPGSADSGDFLLATDSGDDLLVANGKTLGNNTDQSLGGGGSGSVLTLRNGATLTYGHVSAFDFMLVDNSTMTLTGDDGGITMIGNPSSTIHLANGSTATVKYIANQATVSVDGTSSLEFLGVNTPINNATVHLDIGGRLTLHRLAEFTEQGAKIFVDGISYNADNLGLSFSGTGPVTGTAVTNPVPGITAFTANPDALVLSGDAELSWQTTSAGQLTIDDGTGVLATYTASGDGQAFLDSGVLRVSNVSATTLFTLSATIAEDGSGAANTAQATVTITTPGVGTDADQDGLSDLDEANLYSTDPNRRDSDGDGTPDGLEVERGLDPTDPAEFLERPNILFFFVDDLGYGDIGCFWQDQKTGIQTFDTPHLDTLAAEGAKLTHHYISASVCAPSRGSLLQGRHQGHCDIRNSSFDKALPDNHTVADTLRRAGYRTIHVGKNGVAGGEGSVNLAGTGSRSLAGHPLDRGFDEFFGYLFHADGHEHYPQNGTSNKGAHIYDGYRQVTDASLDLYTTDAWAAYAKKAIIEEVQDGDHQPFFLYLAYDTPHFKMQRPAVGYPIGGGLAGGIQWTTATDGSGNVRYASTADGTGAIDGYNHPDNHASWPTSNQQHVGMIRRIDNTMGDLVQLLTDLGIADNTLVIFSSDNGPHNEGNNPRYFESFANMEGIKRDMWEAGIRVPTIVRWPNHIAGATGNPDSIHDIGYPSAIWDWMPTFADMAEVPAPAWCDGVSLLPTLTGNGTQRDKGYLYFEFNASGSTPNWSEFPNHRGEVKGQMQCIRMGDYMGVRTGISGASDDFQVYDVVADPGQATNLAATLPNVHQRMKDVALQGRRVSGSYSRPYDSAPVPPAPRSVVPGLNYSSYEGIWSFVPEFRDLPSTESGSVTNVDLSVRSREDQVGLLFSGYIEIPATGDYSFRLTSDSGASLFIHDAHVVDDDFNHDGSEASGTIKLGAGLHPIRLYYRHGKAATHQLDLSWQGPGIASQPVPASALFRPPEINLSLGRTDQNLALAWTSTSGQTYRVRGTDSLHVLQSVWPYVQSALSATPPTNSLHIPLPPGEQHYYLVEEE